MKRSRLWSLLAATLPLGAGADTVHYLTPDGWKEESSEAVEGGLTVHLDPAAIGAGRTALVLNKPEWMTLGDESPPFVAGVRVDDRSLTYEPGLMLGAFWQLPDEIRVAIRDEDNPLDQRSLRVRLDGREEGLDWEFLPAAGPAPQKVGELRIRPHELVPGTHEISLALADRSPFARPMTQTLRLAVNGHRVSENGQRLTLVAGGVEYVVRPDFRRFLSLGDLGVHAHPTLQFRRPFYSVLKFSSIEPVVDEPGHQVIRVEAVPSELNSQRPSRHVALQFEFELAGASKLLRVTTRALNRSTRAGEMYCYWGLFPGSGYQLPAGEGELIEREWSMQYQDLGAVDWIFLKPVNPNVPGLGIVTSQPLGESRFGSLLIYTDPKKTSVPKEGQVELTFGVVPAASADEVVAARRQFERAIRPPDDGGTATTLPT